MLYVATVNIPGYLPESDPYLTESNSSAWEWLTSELERDAEGVADGGRPRDYDSALATVAHLAADPDGPLTGVWVHDASDPYDLGLVYSVDIYSGPCEWSEDCERLATTTRETVTMGDVPVCDEHTER